MPAHLTDDELVRLIRSRLLRLEERYGTQRIELTHDVLTGVVREQRDRRRAEDEKSALAAQLEQERHALEHAAAQREAELERQRLLERERRLESEARAGRRFRWLSVALAVACAAAVALAVAATAQTRAAERASYEAATARDQTEQLRQLAQRRLDVVHDGIRMKQAVLTGNGAAIDEYLQRGRSPVALTVKAASLNYRDATGAEIFRFTLAPDVSTLPADRAVSSITYRLDHSSVNTLLATSGPDRDFATSYNGWGCLETITVLIEFYDPTGCPS